MSGDFDDTIFAPKGGFSVVIRDLSGGNGAEPVEIIRNFPTLVQDPIDQVFVAVYDVSPHDESTLDQWEQADTGLYRKTKVRVATMTGSLVVWTYVLDAYEGGLPSAVTLGVPADAADAADAPDDYVAALRRRPCRSTGL